MIPGIFQDVNCVDFIENALIAVAIIYSNNIII